MKLIFVEVIYLAYACDCPSWVSYKSYYDHSHHDPDSVSFDNIKYGFYVEPAGDNDSLYLITHNRTHVMLYGRVDRGLRYPKNNKFIDPDPPLGKVFIYNAYKVIDIGDTVTIHMKDNDAKNE